METAVRHTRNGRFGMQNGRCGATIWATICYKSKNTSKPTVNCFYIADKKIRHKKTAL